MKIEYEEFENVGDLFLYLVSAAPPMKNTMPITVYKGNVMSFIPLSPATGESYLVLYALIEIANMRGCGRGCDSLSCKQTIQKRLVSRSTQI